MSNTRRRMMMVQGGGVDIKELLAEEWGVDVSKVYDVDLGTLTWAYQGAYHRFLAEIPVHANGETRKVKAYLEGYECISDGRGMDISWDNVLYLNTERVYIHDMSVADANVFRNKMSGKILYYNCL